MENSGVLLGCSICSLSWKYLLRISKCHAKDFIRNVKNTNPVNDFSAKLLADDDGFNLVP